MNDDKTQEILEKLEQGIKDTMDSEKWRNFLKVQSQFHQYSFNNAMLIYLQKPDATHVAGFRAWQEKFERNVIRGEKGIGILAPCPYKYEKDVEVIKDGKSEIEKKTVEGLRFKKVTVFDINQTEGKPLPEICQELQGNSSNSSNVIKAIKDISDIPVIEKPIESGSKGYYSRTENIIAVKEGMGMDQTAKTLIHEYVHSQLHSTDDSKLLDRATKEVQAESVAFIVANRFGIDTSEYSFQYLASWSSGKDLKELKSSFDIIQKTSNTIIEKIEKAFQKDKVLQKEPTEVNYNETLESRPVLEKVQEQYMKEYPPIKYISEKTAKIIDNLNSHSDSRISIDEIKEMYKNVGKKIEGNYSKTDMEDFKTLKDVVDDLKHAQLVEKQEVASQKAQVRTTDMDLTR